MPIVSQSDFRANMSKLLDQVEDDCKELIIFRQGKKAMVVMPLDEFESWKETEYLLSSPANSAQLAELMAQADRGEYIELSERQLQEMLESRTEDAA